MADERPGNESEDEHKVVAEMEPIVLKVSVGGIIGDGPDGAGFSRRVAMESQTPQ
jgi:hypothetical protein